jgi:hypothetical protein
MMNVVIATRWEGTSGTSSTALDPPFPGTEWVARTGILRFLERGSACEPIFCKF